MVEQDLSLENTMISDLANLRVKVIDLGLTQKFDLQKDDFRCTLGRVGKLQYMCPEVGCLSLSMSLDIYIGGVDCPFRSLCGLR